MNPEYQLPANVDAERTLLGAVLLDNQAWPEICEKLRADDLSLDSHRKIALGMKRLADAGSAIDIVTLANELSRYKWIEAVGGIAYLASLTEGLPRRPVIEEYIRIVKDKSVLRKFMAICQSGLHHAQEQSDTALEVIGAHETALQKITEGSSGGESGAVASFIVDTSNKVVREYADKTPPAIPTGNAWLDAKMGGGFRKGRYTIIAARPKVGKSGAGVLATAYNCARGTRVVWFSLEMDKDEVTLNLIPHVTELSNITVARHWVRTADQQQRVLWGLGTIAEWPLSIYDGDMDCDQVCWMIDKEARKTGDVLFVLDHFGLLGGGDKDIRKRYVENSERLRKKIKRYPNAALLNLFQLSEVPREYADKRPQPGDISESKKPLQDCFAMILLHRYQDKESMKMTGKGNVNLALIRGGGAPSNIDCEFDSRRLCYDPQAELEYNDYYA